MFSKILQRSSVDRRGSALDPTISTLETLVVLWTSRRRICVATRLGLLFAGKTVLAARLISAKMRNNLNRQVPALHLASTKKNQPHLVFLCRQWHRSF